MMSQVIENAAHHNRDKGIAKVFALKHRLKRLTVVSCKTRKNRQIYNRNQIFWGYYFSELFLGAKVLTQCLICERRCSSATRFRM